MCTDAFFPDYPPGESRESVGNVAGSYPFAEFKGDVESALVEKFGRAGVTRGKKAFDVHPNSYRVDADVVAAFEHRRYTTKSPGGVWRYLSGTAFRPENGGLIKNWPQQHYENGVAKNGRTGNRFKYLTRALKRLRNEMHENEVAAAGPIPSYLIECLVWNVPDDKFGHEEYVADMRSILAHSFNSMLKPEECNEWGEVNELKYLFRDGQPWTLLQARTFIDAAWNYVGYK